MSCCSAKNPENTCPVKMSDGRSMTDYRPKCMVNYEILNNLTNNNITKSSYESRMYLQHNAEKIIEQQRQFSINNLTPCAPCKRPFTDSGTMYPEKYIVTCDSVSCNTKEFNSNGLGQGRIGLME
tara:strand:- start:456 stop:830 length:375 start_codon:yes stop_codon:yes gene_type:complete